MPRLGKKSFKPNPLPKDLRSAEEVFVIKETNEVFRSYDEYVNRIILYGFQVWGCQLTGKTNLKYGEAVASEEQALKRLESFPKYLEKPILQLVHHSTCALQTLVQQCYKYLEKEYVENEPVECYISGKRYQGRISRIHRQPITGNKTDVRYDIECDSMQDCLKDIPSGDIKRLKKMPSEEMVSCFIRANTENPWRNDNSPWIVKTEVAKKYSLPDKLNDFSLVLSKTTTPSSKNPTKGNKSNEKAKKKTIDQSAGHRKPGVNKTNLSQRKLDSFTKSIDNSNVTVSLTKLSDKSLDKFTPAKKDRVKICSSSEKDDDKTPSGQLRGTPVKCKLVLTPIKSPYHGGISRSPARKKSGVNNGENKTKKTMVIEDDTNDVIITGCKSPKINSGKKIKKSPRSGKAQKTLGGTENSNKKNLKGGTVSKKLDLLKSVTADNVKEKEHIKQAGSKGNEIPKPESFVQKRELLNVDSDSDKDFESTPHKVTVKPKQSSSKMKQMTLLDLTKKSDDQDTVLPLSPKMKAKKQKTLSEMFSAAIPKDKPINQLMNALTSKTAQQASSSSCLNFPTTCVNQAFVVEKSNVDKERLHSFRKFNKENGLLNKTYWQKLEDNMVLNSKPLPLAKAVNMPSGITAEIFGDVAMIADFVYTFRDLLVPGESLHISIDNLSQALVAGKEGFPLLSRILFIFLQILLQDRSTKGQELGMQLAEMPLTRQSASEVSRLYLNSKFKMLTSYGDDKQLHGILESLQHEDFYNLTPEEKTKILVILCHEVLSSDAMDDYIGSQLTEATELRKQKIAKQKAKNDKIREEKERKKKEKEELLKQKEEEENKKQLKVDELSKKETGSDCGNVEKLSLLAGTETSNKNVEKKITNAKMEMPAKEQSKEVSDVVKTLRKRREDMAGKNEKKLKEEKERLEKEEEEQWKIDMAQCQYTLRLNPIGHDRNHARYWVFNGAAAGVFVEQGWWNLDNPSRTAEEPSKENREVEGDRDIEMVEETSEVENKIDSFAKVNEREWRFPDISYEWLCYSTVEEVQTLIDHLSHQGIRESALKKSLKEKLTAVSDGINRRNASRKPAKPETGEDGVFSSIKEELKDTAERLVCGNLAVLHEGLEEYQHTVDQASTISDLASQLEKLLPAVLPQFHQGLFSKDKKGSEEAKQRWLDVVKQATTVSRLHLLLEILDSTVIWDLSAENARCKICRLKGIGTTLILCDDCNLGYHLQCLRPALSEVPEGHWGCPACKPNERQSSRTSTKNYKEESGSEVDDEEEPSEASIDDSDESSEDESDQHEDYCHTCGEDGNLICCDSCPLVFHKDCHQPPLRHIPRGAWSCWQCRQPKNKKQKENQRGGQMKSSEQAKNKGKKPGSRDGSSLRSSKLKRPHSRSSEESGSETVSKRTRQSRQPIKIVDSKSARGKRRNARGCIEDTSDDESSDGKKKSKTTQCTGKVVKNGRTSSRLQRMGPHDSDDENEEKKGSKSNAKSFYGKSTGRAPRQNISSQEEDMTNKRCTNASRSSGRGSRRNRPQILDDSEDEDVEDEEESGKENRQSSLRKTGSRSKSSQRPARKSTRNQRQIPSSPEESEVGDEDTSRNRSASSSFEESEESGLDTSKRQALRNASHGANKANKVTATRKTQVRRGDKNYGDRTHDDKVKSNSQRNGSKEKGKKDELRNSSTTKDNQKPAKDTRRTEVLQEETKRRRVNVEMGACEQIIRDLLLHEDSWPFTQAVNLREVPDYLELVATPMDLGTIKEKLKTLQYPDVDSFVSDVRLVFTNSDKYNLSNSDVGQAGKNLEKYFDKLFKENLSNKVKKTKVQRKR